MLSFSPSIQTVARNLVLLAAGCLVAFPLHAQVSVDTRARDIRIEVRKLPEANAGVAIERRDGATVAEVGGYEIQIVGRDVSRVAVNGGHIEFFAGDELLAVASVSGIPSPQPAAATTESRSQPPHPPVRIVQPMPGPPEWEFAETLALVGPTEPISCIAFAPDGSKIAAATNTGEIRVWRMAHSSRCAINRETSRRWSSRRIQSNWCSAVRRSSCNAGFLKRTS